MSVLRMDHLVITVSDLDRAVAFYCNVLDLKLVNKNAENTLATLAAGELLIRLQTPRRSGALVAAAPAPGTSDLCLEVDEEPAETLARMERLDIDVVAGPVTRHGMRGKMQSVYVRDPDGSLIELASYGHQPR